MNCGCRCTTEMNTLDWDRKIIFCPLHASAKKIKNKLSDLRVGYGDLFSENVRMQVDALLAEAEGRHE